MKKIFYTTFLAILSFNCKAQLTIVPIQNKYNVNIQSNTYLMDVEGLLDPYVGTWLYTNGTTSLKFILRKEFNNNNGYYHEDVLYGEYQYIQDGVEKINTLNQIDNIYSSQAKHTIGGNYIINKNVYTRCNECEENEKRVYLFMGDPLTGGRAADLILRRIMDSGQPAIVAYIRFDGIKDIGSTIDDRETEFVDSTISNGNYILIKIN